MALGAASPVVATVTGVVALGANWPGARVPVSARPEAEFAGALAAEYRAWTNEANAAATNERLSRMRAAPAAGTASGSTAAPAQQPQAPTAVTTPTPTSTPAPATGAVPCPPGQMMGPKGTCETEKDIPCPVPDLVAGHQAGAATHDTAAGGRAAASEAGRGWRHVRRVLGSRVRRRNARPARARTTRRAPSSSVERRRSTDVGGRGLISGFGGTGGSKFGSDSLQAAKRRRASAAVRALQTSRVRAAVRYRGRGRRRRSIGDRPIRSANRGTPWNSVATTSAIGERQPPPPGRAPAHWPRRRRHRRSPESAAEDYSHAFVETASEWLGGRKRQA
ncbi:MAG: hypothetical protein MZV49_05730 [Rhodopseudomonas palustris]|nr:hypothetical protein [Rhodopseudomonas palustris]